MRHRPRIFDSSTAFRCGTNQVRRRLGTQSVPSCPEGAVPLALFDGTKANGCGLGLCPSGARPGGRRRSTAQRRTAESGCSRSAIGSKTRGCRPPVVSPGVYMPRPTVTCGVYDRASVQDYVRSS